MTDPSGLDGAALDAAVAVANGWCPAYDLEQVRGEWGVFGSQRFMRTPHYSTLWAAAGPIIERERISISFDESEAGSSWIAYCIGGHEGSGPTPLVAAMRAYVASKEDR